MNKALIRTQIADGKLREAIRSTLTYAHEWPDTNWYQDALLLSGDHEAMLRSERTGQADHDDLRKQRNQITAGLLGLLDEMPDASPGVEAASQPKGMREGTLKTGVAVTLLGGKLMLLLWANFHRQTGGLSKEEFFSVMGYLMPIFVAYLSIILTSYLRQRHQHSQTAKRIVPTGLVYLTFTLIPAYVWSFSLGISWRAQGDFTLQDMNQWLAIVESAMGVYIGIIVSELFNGEEKK